MAGPCEADHADRDEDADDREKDGRSTPAAAVLPRRGRVDIGL